MIVNFSDVTTDQIVQMIISESANDVKSVTVERDGLVSIIFSKDTVQSVKDSLLEWEAVSYDATFPWYIAAANTVKGDLEIAVKAK